MLLLSKPFTFYEENVTSGFVRQWKTIMEAIWYGMKIALDYDDDVQPVTINHTNIHA